MLVCSYLVLTQKRIILQKLLEYQETFVRYSSCGMLGNSTSVDQLATSVSGVSCQPSGSRRGRRSLRCHDDPILSSSGNGRSCLFAVLRGWSTTDRSAAAASAADGNTHVVQTTTSNGPNINPNASAVTTVPTPYRTARAVRCSITSTTLQRCRPI